MIIGNFTPLDLRTDKGALWENFLISERIKQNEYKNSLSRTYLRRTKQRQEIDFVEEKNGQLFAYEFKWSDKKQAKIPKTFLESYNAKGQTINKKNFRPFVII